MGESETKGEELFQVRARRRALRKHRQVDNTQSWIIEAFLELLEADASKKVSIAAICKRAGVGRTTFYRYFQSIDDIIESETERTIDDVYQQLEQLGEIPLTEYTLNRVALETFKKHPKIARLAKSMDLMPHLTEAFDLVSRDMEVLYRFPRFGNRYEQAFRRSGVNAVYLAWLKGGMKESPEEIAQLLRSYLLRP